MTTIIVVRRQRVNRPTHKPVKILQKYKDKQFFLGVDTTLIEGELVTQLFSHVGIMVWQIVWVMTNCCFMSNMTHIVPLNASNH